MPDALETRGREIGAVAVRTRCAAATRDVDRVVRALWNQPGDRLQVTGARGTQRVGLLAGALAPPALVPARDTGGVAAPSARCATPASDMGATQTPGAGPSAGSTQRGRVRVAGAEHGGRTVASQRPHGAAPPPVECPSHFEVRLVSANGGIKWEHRWVNDSHVLGGEYVGFEEIDDGE